MMGTVVRWAPGLLLVALLAVLPMDSAAQDRSPLVVRIGGSEVTLTPDVSRGFAALPASEMAALGWGVDRTDVGVLLVAPDGAEVRVTDGTPVVRWDGALLQLSDPPYFQNGQLHLPLQFVTDFLPWKLEDVYRFDPRGMVLAVAGIAAPPSVPLTAAPPASGPTPAPERVRASADGQKRVVIIDAGHGGHDPGTVGRGGVREKEVALGIALAMADALRGRDDLDVVLIRDDDTFVPLWDRGAIGTRIKGERNGIFVSIHANSFSNNARGFETYFLSEARTEDERRVAAIENAPLGVESASDEGGGDLDFILRELKSLDQQHWSSLLAELIQGELDEIHPGPNRGVKQGPLAVLTNAIMPSVLVEIGYLSHPQEARLLAQAGFQKEAGRAVARAVEQFLERYPPGTGSGAGEDG